MVCINKTPMHSGVPQALAQTPRRELASRSFWISEFQANFFGVLAARFESSQPNETFTFHSGTVAGTTATDAAVPGPIRGDGSSRISKLVLEQNGRQQRVACNSFPFVLFTYRTQNHIDNSGQFKISTAVQVLPAFQGKEWVRTHRHVIGKNVQQKS